MAKSLGLNHINLSVSDIARSEKFYLDGFGLDVRFREGSDMVFIGSRGGTTWSPFASCSGRAHRRWRRVAFWFSRSTRGVRRYG